MRGLSLLFICLLSIGMGQSLFFALLPPSATKPFLGLDGTNKHLMPSGMGFANDSLGRLVIMDL